MTDGDQEPPKKDLTSLIELSKLEMEKHPLPPDGDPTLNPASQDPITEADFESLEEMSKRALSAPPAELHPAPAQEPVFEEPAAPEVAATQEAAPAEPDVQAAAAQEELIQEPVTQDAPTQESAASTDFAANDLSGIPGLGASDSAQSSEAPPENAFGDIPGLGEPPVGQADTPEEEFPALVTDDHVIGASEREAPALAMTGFDEHIEAPEVSTPPEEEDLGDEKSSVDAEPAFVVKSPPASQAAATVAAPTADSESDPAPDEQTTTPETDAKPTEEKHEPLVAPPAGVAQAKKSAEPSAQKQDLDQVKKFAEKIAIGRPHIEASPAFSVLITSDKGAFDEKAIMTIRDVLTADDYGIRIEDVEVQLSAGKLLVPQISEFAAITIAQKLRDVVDNIQLDLAGEIFKSESMEEEPADDDSFFVDEEHYQQRREEIHDLALEPRDEKDLFSTNLSELSDYEITRILSAVTASEIIDADVAENPTSRLFEAATDRVTRELVSRAFKLGAHGVIGLGFTMRPIDVYKDPSGRVRRAYRLLGTGTAVRARKKDVTRAQ